MTFERKEPYTLEAHKARHVALHAALDELLADFIAHTGKGLTATVGDLMTWSCEQTENPSSPSSSQR